ncbi:hypothetical protein K431DRAFT_292911 [Polychaeton citri CBS 116435]|uniref:Uncharacterized protein n=1 Tax=Polychaeton citri CBS 116435 TaxID=1314669 RepID=A0A9P4Q9P4_9PEZI|nr:hypothetical protein K431DRAFT_292911 [Polychaeton citri CBS 116435]
MTAPSVAMLTQESPPDTDSLSSLEYVVCTGMMHVSKLVTARQRHDQNTTRVRVAEERDKLSSHHYDHFPHLQDQNREAIQEATSDCHKSKARFDQLARDLLPVAQGIVTAIRTLTIEAAVPRREFQEHLAEFRILKTNYSKLDESVRAARAENVALRARAERAEQSASENQKLSERSQEELTRLKQRVTDLQDATVTVDQLNQQRALDLQQNFATRKKEAEESIEKCQQLAQVFSKALQAKEETFHKAHYDIKAQFQKDQAATQTEIAEVMAYSKDLTKKLDEHHIRSSTLHDKLDHTLMIARTTDDKVNRIQGDFDNSKKLAGESSQPRIESLEGKLVKIRREVEVLTAAGASIVDTSGKCAEIERRLSRIERDFGDSHKMLDDREGQIHVVIAELRNIDEKAEACRSGLERLEKQLESTVGTPTRADVSRSERNPQHHLASSSAPLGIADTSPFSSTLAMPVSLKDVHDVVDKALAVYPNTDGFQDVLSRLRSSRVEDMQVRVLNLENTVKGANTRFGAKLLSEARDLQKMKTEFQEMQNTMDGVVAALRRRDEVFAALRPANNG